MVEEHDLRKAMLMGTKTERIIFAATPELKAAAQFLSNERNREVLPDDIFD